MDVSSIIILFSILSSVNLFQAHNGLRLEYRGYGLRIDLMAFTAEELANAMVELVENSTYREAVQHASKVIRNRPMNARQLGGYWVDHVIRFGSQHMRSYAYDIPFYQYILLDVIAFLFVCVISLCILFTCCVYRLFFRKSTANIIVVKTRKNKSKKIN